MISCERPTAGRTPYRFFNFSTRNIIFDGIGTAVNAVFPNVRRVAVLDLQTEAGIVSLSLSSSLINGTALDTVGVFVAMDRGEALSLDGGIDVFLSHITRQNSIPGLPVASSRSNALSFGQDSAYKLGSGARLALYACSANVADNEISAICSVYWTPAAAL